MKKIVIAGQGLSAAVLASYLQSDVRYQFMGYTVDDEFYVANEKSVAPCVPLSKLEEIFPSSSHAVLMGIGYSNMNRSRQSLFQRLTERGYRIEGYVSPMASVASVEQLGEGCVVLAGAVIEPYSKVGNNSVIWSNVTVAHHSSIGSHCWLASGAVISGQVNVGDNCFVGVNATVVNKIEVGEGCFIGAGALITKNTQPNTVHIARGSESLRYSADDYVKFFI